MTEMFHMRVPQKELSQWKKKAKKQGISLTQLVLSAVREGLQPRISPTDAEPLERHAERTS